MSKIAVIGGSRFASLKNLVITHSTSVKTPFGEPSAPLTYGILGEQEVVYLPRRGSTQPMPPHEINYRANLWALRDAGVQTVLATAAVAGITNHFQPGDLVVPDQLIDYTYGRQNTFLGESEGVTHINFAEPFSANLRANIIKTAKILNFPLTSTATYAVSQGPRLETIAEINRLERDGCHIVGMTGMPEAALARELDLEYACIAIVIRLAAGRNDKEIDHVKVKHNEKCVELLVEKLILDKGAVTIT